MLFQLFAIASLICGLQADLEYDGRLQIKLDHVLDDALAPTYQFRGEVTIKSLHSGSVGLDQIQLNSNELALLRELALKNENYRLKATVKTPDNRQSIFYTFASACSLLESKLSDILYVNLDNVGNVVSISLATQTPCSHTGDFPATNGELITAVYVRHMELGPVPDTASYVQKLEREREAKDRGETKDNRSFLAKYWMYIVPVVIFVVISSASNPEAGGGGQ